MAMGLSGFFRVSRFWEKMIALMTAATMATTNRAVRTAIIRLGRLDSPGVHPDWRHTGVRSALLNAVNARLRHQGITRISVDSCGDTPAELAHDLALGLGVVDETPILAPL